METKFLPHFTILFAAIILAWYFETFDFGFFKYTSKKKGDAVDELLKKKHQVIGKECIPNTNTCFLIVDSYYLENGRLTTKRDLLLEENTEYSLTGVEIESTKPVSWENLDSRDWAVNKVVINSRYARLLVASGFIMEGLGKVIQIVREHVGPGPVIVIHIPQTTTQNKSEQIEAGMLNQQHNQGAQQLLNVQRPHQIQPPGQHRQGQMQQQSQNQMQQGQHVNMGQQQMPQQRSVIQQPGPSNSQQVQSQQGQMMNMGQQNRSQMMQNSQHQQQIRGNPQQMRQGQQMQSQQQQPQMSQMRMQQNQQNMNVPQQRIQNMQQNNQQGMRMPQNQQQQRMQPQQQQHQQLQQQGGSQNMGRPSPQPIQMQQGGQQNINRPPSQQMQQTASQGMNRASPQLNNLPPTSSFQQQPRVQQMQQNQQNMNSGSPQQHQMHQGQQSGPQQQMRIQQTQQQQDQQMQQGQATMNGPPQQQSVRVAQVFPVQAKPNVQRSSQVIRGPMQNSPQNAQMRMGQQAQQNQGQALQPIRPNTMGQQRQIAQNQQRQQLQQQGSMPHQQNSQQRINQPQPINHPQSMKQDIQQNIQTVAFEPDNGQTIRINGEHAIINGMQYKLVPQNQETQQGHSQQNQQNPPAQQMQHMQQRGQNNQVPNQQQQQQQQPAQQQQQQQQQQNLQNQQITPNQNNRQNQQMQSNMRNQQTPPVPQQNAPGKSKPRSRTKKPPVPEPMPTQTVTPEKAANQQMPTSSSNLQTTPSTSGSIPAKRRIMPPSLTPLKTDTTPPGQNSSRSGSHPPQQRMVQQGKNMVQVGGAPPNRQLTTPQKANPRQQQPKQGVLGNQKPNGRVQSGGPARTSQPSTSRRRTNENKENMIEIRDAILSHVRGTRKMTAEYTNYVQEELSRVLKELEKLELTHDSRYISVKRLLALVKGEDPKKIETPEKAPKPPQKEPIEVIELEEEEPKEETKEERQSRYDGYMKFLKDSYPETSWNVNFPFIDETTIKNEAVLYREQDMKEREAYLRKIVDTLPEEEQTKTKIEYLGLSLLDFQTELRKQIMETTVLVPPTEFLINPWSIRRTKQEYALELKQHPDRAALEKKRKSSNYAFLQSVIKHSREFKEFHKRNLANHTKVRKSMQQYITNEAKRVAREEMKNEKIRIQKLIQEDEEGYRAMLDDKKDRRLVYLLEQTDDYIKSLCDLLKQQQNSTSGSTPVKKTPRKEYDGLAEEEKVKSILDKARNDEDEYENKAKMNIEDYYTTAHGVREEIMQQHTMMGGGNASLKLKPYQLKGLEWMVSLYNNNLNGILADEMGLGKTIQTIAFITYLIQVKKSSGPFLVIVPLSTVPNWKNEFDKWAPNVHLIVYKGNKDARKLNEPIIKTGKFNVLLTTFEYVIREKALLGKLRWKYMMIDEGHRLKNQHCKLTDMLNTRFQCQRRLLITGTPLQNKLPELWALLNFLLPSIFSSCSTFEQWFNAPFATTGEKVELTSEETMLIIRRLHKVLRPFLLRRLKKEVESELPDKMEFVIKCEMSGLQKVLYKHMQKGLLLDGKTTSGSRSLMNTMVHLRKLCNHPFLFQNVEESCRCFWETKQITAMDLFRVSGKLELLDRILPKLKATGHRVLMFFQMTAMMTVVEDYLAGTTINYLRLDGSTKPDDRGLLLDKFNAPNSKYFLFMLSTRAGGLGLNLQTADTVIIFDSDWNPHQDMQAQDRAHRIGQKAEVRVFRLITANSVEEKILAAARFKLNVDEKVIQAGKFDNRSTGAERRQILENIIKAENENDEDEEVPNDEAINDILSRSEEEFDLFQKMDQERFAHEKRINAKPRLCGDDEIPKDILRAADETEYIEKAKEEGVIPYLEVMPGSKRARKEVDYSTDTMSDDKFLEKLFDGEDVTPTKSDPKPDAVSEPKVTPKAIPRPEPVKETPKAAIPATPSPVEPPHPKIPPLTFKVPRLIVKFGSGLKRKPETSESDSVTPPKAPKLPEVESKKEDDNILKRKDPPLGKIRIKFGGEPLEKYTRIETDNTPKKLLDEKHRKEEKSEKHQSGDDSTPKKKKKHRERDEEGSSERKKKHKHKHHRQEEESPSKSHHKHDKESPLKSHHKNDKGSSSSSLDTDASSKTVPKVINDSPLTQVSQPSTSSSEPSKPPLKLKLTFKFPPLPPSTPVNGSDPKKDSETKTDSTPKKDTTPKVDSEPKTSSSEKKAHGEHKKHKEHKEHKEKKHSKEHKEHKKKSREGETEEERRARKEAKRLKRQSGDQEDDAKRQEKLARKAARKEQKRLDKEKEKLETSSGSLPENAAGTA